MSTAARTIACKDVTNRFSSQGDRDFLVAGACCRNFYFTRVFFGLDKATRAAMWFSYSWDQDYFRRTATLLTGCETSMYVFRP